MSDGRPYDKDDFSQVEAIDPDMTVGELAARLRDELGLDRLLPTAKSELKLNVDRLVPTGVPLQCVVDPSESPGGFVGLNLAPPARVALALIVRDVILPALTKPTETSLRKRRKHRQGA